MGYWFRLDGSDSVNKGHCSMTQKIDSPDGAAELLISLILSSPGPQICLLAFRLVITLTPEGVWHEAHSSKPIKIGPNSLHQNTPSWGWCCCLCIKKSVKKKIKKETVCVMQSSREEKKKESGESESNDTSCPLLSYGWIRLALRVATRFPGPGPPPYRMQRLTTSS